MTLLLSIKASQQIGLARLHNLDEDIVKKFGCKLVFTHLILMSRFAPSVNSEQLVKSER